MEQMFFLSGIARSGSTLLGSILNQNPDIYVSPTSPLMDLFCLTEQSYQQVDIQYTFDKQKSLDTLHNVLASTFYQHIDKKYVIDKHRGWPKNISQIQRYITPNPKVICTYRPTAENICSFLKLINKDPNNSVDRDLRQKGLEINLYNRAMMLWYNYSSDPYYSLKFGLENFRDNILVVNYNDIIGDASQEVKRVYDFLEIPHYEHNFESISNTCSEVKDTAWGFEGLHNIRSTITKTSDNPKEVLGKDLFEFFEKFDNELLLVG